MNVLICIDRDGTIIYDEKYYLGMTDDWRSKLKLCSKVIEGLQELRKLDAKIYMITNQPGIAVKEYEKLTLNRAHEVCVATLQLVEYAGVKLDGYFLCPHAQPEYVATKLGKHFNKDLVCDCTCIKPNLGMVFDALKKEGWNLHNTKVFVIGDRVSDVQTGINSKGYGILVPFNNETNEAKKVITLHNSKAIVVKDMVEAAEKVKSLLN